MFQRVARSLEKLNQLYFQLEVLGDHHLAGDDEQNLMFVMNHTAVFGLEVSLLTTHLRASTPSRRLKTLVWSGFLKSPLGPVYKAVGCVEASIAQGVELLNAGENLLVLPEGVGATDVRKRFNHFHSGYLRMVKQASVKPRPIESEFTNHSLIPIIPIGFYGVDEAIPWLVSDSKTLSKLTMQKVDKSFDFMLFPKLPIFRPVKIVLNIGDPIYLSEQDLADEEHIARTNQQIKAEIIRLSNEAKAYREEAIHSNRFNRYLHKVLDGKNTLLS